MHDLRFAFRQLAKSPGFTAVAVLTLALGIGANTAMFSVVHAVMLRPLPYSEPDRIVMVWESGQGSEKRRVSPANFLDWQRENNVFESMAFSPAWVGSREFNVAGLEGIERVTGAYVSSEFFHVCGVTPFLGRTFLRAEDQRGQSPVAVLSHRLWQRRFSGDTNILGKTVTVDSYGRRDYTVVGVMPARSQFPIDAELWLPAAWMGAGMDRRGAAWLEVFARLKPGISLNQAQTEMNTIASRIAQQFPEARAWPHTKVVPLLEEMVGTVRLPLLILSAAVGSVLLIACANIANLLLARAASRQKEIALRLALGAGRWRVIRQLLTESLVLALLSGAVGLLVAYAGVKAFAAASPSNIPRLMEVSIDGTALCFTVGVAVLTGVLFGLAPAWQISRPDLNETLKEGSGGASTGISAGFTRRALVVAEMALATVLLVGAGLMLQSFARLMSADRGFQAEHLLTAELDFSVSGFTTWVRPTATRPQVRLQELIERVRQLPGVQAAGAANGFLRRDNRPPNQSFSIFGRPPLPESERPTSDQKAITPDYLRALGARLLRGRTLTEADALGSPGAVLVNERFVRQFFPNEEPLGRHLTIGSNQVALAATDVYGLPIWSEIVGIVSDVKSLSLRPEAVPEIYWSYWQWPMQSPTLFVRATGDVSLLTAAIRRETKSIIPNLPPPRFRLMNERVGESVAQPRFQAGLLNLFGGVALLLAACGMYGVLAYGVSQRQREIGIRVALGAQERNILWLIIGQGMKPALIGVGVGLAVSFALTRVMRHLLYEVTTTDPLTFVAVSLLLVFVALFACWLPARNAARVDPMEALRYE